MAKSTANLQLGLAYRLGEDAAPETSGHEYARRLAFLNEAYRDVMRRHFWWFSEATSTFNSVAAQDSYGTTDGVPSDIRLILELRFQNVKYNQINQVDAMNAYQTPYKNASQSYFVFNSKIYPVPPFSSSVTNGVTIKYYKTPTELTSASTSVLIPDIFTDCLIAYAYGRVCQIDDERGSAKDGMDEYEEIIKLMTEEQNKYLFSLKGGNDPALSPIYP